MIVGVVGGSKFKDKNRVYFELKELGKKIKIHRIISGGGPGTDTHAEEFADEFKIAKTIFKADWDDMAEPCYKKVNSYGKEYNALAGFNRNTKIAYACQMLVAFWDGKSPGTADTIKKAKEFGKQILIINVKY